MTTPELLIGALLGFAFGITVMILVMHKTESLGEKELMEINALERETFKSSFFDIYSQKMNFENNDGENEPSKGFKKRVKKLGVKKMAV